jgi:spermidine/putrescine transport system substrate-binding protein
MHNKLNAMLLASLLLLTACGSSEAEHTPTPEPMLAESLIFYDWPEDLVEVVFEEFTQEYGVQVRYMSYNSQEEAVENIRNGEVYDLVVMENQYVPALIAEGLLAEIDYRHVPNFKNISANFRDLNYDPENKHSVPYSWGTTGLLVRSDLVSQPISHWSDLWDSRYAGQVALWELPRYTLGIALKSLGYSVNTENPAELEITLQHLLELKPNAAWLYEEETSADIVVSGEAVMAAGWAYDVWQAQEQDENVIYVLPWEGAILWGDNFVIPANSPRKYTAEVFLNFLLRPEISGRIINENYYPMANEAATPFVDPEILNDPVVYPTNKDLQNAEILLPLSAEGEKLYAKIWERFMAAGE